MDPRQAHRSASGRVLDGKYELLELVEFVGDRDRTSLWKGVVHGAAGFTRDVAIRKLPSSTAARRTALRGASLEHANVVRVYDVCQEADDSLYLVMEWIDGVPLDELARGAHQLGLRVPWPLIGCIGVGALHGLAAGHARTRADGRPAPALHGHLSSRSVLLDRRGVVHLTPFGLARRADHVPIEAWDERPTIGGDLRDLAVVLWQALTGAPPLEGDVGAAPRGLIDALTRALSPAPQLHFPSADAFAGEVAAALGRIPWRRGPQADLGDAVKEVIAALAWSPGAAAAAPIGDDVPHPVFQVHLAPSTLAAARRLPFDLSDEPDGDEPYVAYELRA